MTSDTILELYAFLCMCVMLNCFAHTSILLQSDTFGGLMRYVHSPSFKLKSSLMEHLVNFLLVEELRKINKIANVRAMLLNSTKSSRGDLSMH